MNFQHFAIGTLCAEHGKILDEFFLSTAGKSDENLVSRLSNQFCLVNNSSLFLCAMKENSKLKLEKDGQLRSFPEEMQE